MIPKVIKNDGAYEATLQRIEELMDAEANTPEGDELELLATLAELYEEKHSPLELPDPIEAIRFRMEQAGLKQQDLVPYIGSRGKVSEVLNGRRTLSLRMIRALHAGLGIPAEVLLREPGATLPDEMAGLECDKFPLSEMLRRNWIPGFKGSPSELKERAEEALRAFFQPLGGGKWQPALARQHVRGGSTMDKHALLAWQAKVMILARQQSIAEYEPLSITPEFMQRLVGLSYMNEGPKLAQEFLGKNGIHLIALRHLTRTHLDGAAMMLPGGVPIVALTLRYNRLDNFWFTLCHEIAHLALHFEKDQEDWFVDDLDVDGDALENEADRFAADSLIPKEKWQRPPVKKDQGHAAVRTFAESLGVHPAIVAGRIRWEQKDYRILSRLVGQGSVRPLFADQSEWPNGKTTTI